MSNLELEDVIVGAVEDATNDVEPEVDVTENVTTDESAVTTSSTEPTAELDGKAARDAEAAAAAKDGDKQDDFDKKHGLQPESVLGRENRIPYSRVRKIADKAALDAKTAAIKEANTTYQPKIAAYEAKIKDYESRLQPIGQFEQFMSNDREGFLTWLANSVPGYRELFQQLLGSPTAPAATPVEDLLKDMPQPDQKLADGSMVYSQDGLRKYASWQREQAATAAEARVTAQLEKVYGPIRQEYETRQQLNTIVPQIQQQIAEARQWPQFNENEPDIVKALQADQRLDLRGAYQQVVLPKLTNAATISKEREAQIRQEARQAAIADLKRAPSATSAPAFQSRPGAQTPAGPRSLESIIEEQIQGLK